jgi:hypothetical protein
MIFGVDAFVRVGHARMRDVGPLRINGGAGLSLNVGPRRRRNLASAALLL